MKSRRKTALCLIIFPILAALSVWTVVSFGRGFSMEKFLEYLRMVSVPGLVGAVLAMLAYVVTEGLSLRFICGRLGCRVSLGRSLSWSATDIFFSAITPSATGGQPAAAVMMLHDGVPVAASSVALLLNLVCYTLSILILAPVSIFMWPEIFTQFGPVSMVLIVVGSLIQLGLAVVFILLIYKDQWIFRLAGGCLKLLSRLHLVGNLKRRLKALEKKMPEYRACARIVGKDKKLLIGVLGYNLLQRLALLMVPVCVFLGQGGALRQSPGILAAQACVVLGSNPIPLPGAMGVADYLFLDGYSRLVPDVVSMELLSRGISFYGCFLICGLTVLVTRLVHRVQRRRKKT